MKEIGKKEEKFYSEWEEYRKKKWRYIIVHGSVYWGFTVAIVSFLLNSHLELENMQISKLIALIIVFGIGGIGFGLWQFKRIDSIYLGLNDNDKIVKGIQELQSGLIWNYENLKISKDKNGMIIVQNELFWYAKANLSAEILNECFNLIIDDFQRLQKNSNFNKFAKNRNVMIQMFDNSGNEMPLIEEILKL
jgi:hypothetical protein